MPITEKWTALSGPKVHNDLGMAVLDEQFNLTKHIYDLPNEEKMLVDMGYSESDARAIMQELKPEANSAINKMKSLMARWEALDTKKH